MSRLNKARKRKKKHRDLLQDVKEFVESILHGLVSVYMVLVIAVMPFYFSDGYARIGTDKYEFFYQVSTGVGILMLPVLLFYLGMTGYIYFVKEKGRHQEFEIFEKLSLTDRFALGYGVVVILSYLASEYREMTPYGSALKGATGWYMGLITQLIFVGIYFLVSRFWKANKWMPSLFLVVAPVVFALGYVNRFGVWPMEMAYASPSFLSTIGNINWYCGYIIIILMGALYYIWSRPKQMSRSGLALLAWLVVGFATLLTQGSQSGILAMGVVWLLLYEMSAKTPKKLYAFGACMSSMGLACVLTYLLRVCYGERFNGQDAFTDFFTNSPVAIGILALGMFFGVVLPALEKKWGGISLKMFEKAGTVLCVLVGAGVLLFVVLGIWNTTLPGGLGIFTENKWFLFNESWGSSRGATWEAAIRCYGDLDAMGKLLGVGPDCMAMYIHGGKNEELLAMVKENFGNQTLTNAHCEWLTVLVNNGIFGLVTYAGLMISATVRFLKGREAQPIVGACGFAVLAYTVNNMVSFQQVMSATTIFLVLGMGEAYVRRSEMS